MFTNKTQIVNLSNKPITDPYKTLHSAKTQQKTGPLWHHNVALSSIGDTIYRSIQKYRNRTCREIPKRWDKSPEPYLIKGKHLGISDKKLCIAKKNKGITRDFSLHPDPPTEIVDQEHKH